MLRRILYFILALAVIGCVATLVYLNPQPTEFGLTPDMRVTLPLSFLILGGAVAGVVLTFAASLAAAT